LGTPEREMRGSQEEKNLEMEIGEEEMIHETKEAGTFHQTKEAIEMGIFRRGTRILSHKEDRTVHSANSKCQVPTCQCQTYTRILR